MTVQVVHELGGKEFSKQLNEAPNFLLLNKLGGYFWLHEKDISRYQGFYFNNNFKLYKTLHRISLPSSKGIAEAHNAFHSVEHRHKKVNEEYFVPHGFNALVYTLNKKTEFDLIFDCKEQFDNRQYGRYYEISKEDGVIIVKFTKKTDRKEDKSHGKEEFSVYTAIIADGDYRKKDKWLQAKFSYDHRRGSDPQERFVYSALRLKAKDAVIAFALDKIGAIAEAKTVKQNLESLKKKQKEYVQKFLYRAKDDVFFAHAAAGASLDGLFDQTNGHRGIIAGVPWFTQLWTRDELISLKALMLQERFDEVKDILFRYMKELTSDGALPDRYPAVSLGDADGVGWLFKRIGDFYHILEKKNILHKYLSDDDLLSITRKLEFSIIKLLEHHSHAELIINKPKETWMDTIPREGARIEVQALFLNMCSLLKELGDHVEDQSTITLAENKEREVLKKVREQFWNGEMLADGVRDFTCRPNIFLAHYIYPKLLDDVEWYKCFNKALDELWLPWGGIATLDKNHPDFKKEHTGEDNLSYHNGDSWFFINNIAAISLWKVSQSVFKNRVRTISEASANEILWKGFAGHAAEISSASKLESFGCWCQAWSDATYIEMMHEIYDL